jgi:hypothetical protein
MIPMWLVIFWAIFGWIALMFYMLWGRDIYGHPLWFWVGLPAPFVILLAVGHFYYGLPLFDWDSIPAIPVEVIENDK